MIFLFLTGSFSHLPIKQKPDVRIKTITQIIFFFIGYSVKHLQPTAPYQETNVCSRSQFFTIKLINKFESLYTSQLHLQTIFQSVSKVKHRNSNSCYRLLLLLSDDISINPGPFHNHPQLDPDKRNVFNHRGLHFPYFNINSLLLKIDELRRIARLNNAAVREKQAWSRRSYLLF